MEMKKMMEKKKDTSPLKKEAKLSALKSMREMASEMMRGDLDGKMKSKVTVAASDEEGLKKGLEKAQEIVEGKEDSPELDTMEEVMDDDQEKSEEEHQQKALGADFKMGDEKESEDSTMEEIDEMMAKLMEMKKKLASK